MAEKSKYQDIDAVDAALDKGVSALEKATDLELKVSGKEDTIKTKSVSYSPLANIGPNEVIECDIKSGETFNISFDGYASISGSIAIYYSQDGSTRTPLGSKPFSSTTTLVATQDYKYIHFYVDKSQISNSGTLDIKVEVENGCTGIEDDIESIETRLSGNEEIVKHTNDYVCIDYADKTNYIINTNGNWAGGGINYGSIAIKVNPYDVIRISADDMNNNNMYCGFLKSYIPSAGTAIDYATGYILPPVQISSNNIVQKVSQNLTSLKASETYLFVAPTDAKYFVFNNKIYGFDLNIKSLTINNYAVNSSIGNNATNNVVDGNLYYYGNNSIGLSIFDNTYKYKRERIISETYAERKIENTQSMTIYNDLIFVFGDTSDNTDGDVAIYDYKTKSYKGKVDSGISERAHLNSAQFTDVYYDSADAYPLLILSRCYSDNKCYVVRVQPSSDGLVTMTLVKTILPPTEGNNMQINNCYVYDEQRKAIISYGYTLGAWNSGIVGNACKLTAFKCPDLKSSDSYTFTDADVLNVSYMPYRVYQDAHCQNGLMYMTTEQGTEINGVNVGGYKKLEVLNPYTGIVVNLIMPLTETDYEGEGVCVYNGKLYADIHNGLASDDNDFKYGLYEYTV